MDCRGGIEEEVGVEGGVGDGGGVDERGAGGTEGLVLAGTLEGPKDSPSALYH